MEGETYHKQDLNDLYHELFSSKHGLSTEQVKILRETHGLNQLSEKKETPMFVRFLLQFKNFFSILLLVGAGLSLIGHFMSPGQGNDLIAYALIAVTMLNAGFSFFQEYKAQRAMNSFKN